MFSIRQKTVFHSKNIAKNFNLKNVKLPLFKKRSFLFFTPKNRPNLPKKTLLIIRTIFLPNFTQVLTKFLPPFTSVEYGQNFVRVFLIFYSDLTFAGVGFGEDEVRRLFAKMTFIFNRMRKLVSVFCLCDYD